GTLGVAVLADDGQQAEPLARVGHAQLLDGGTRDLRHAAHEAPAQALARHPRHERLDGRHVRRGGGAQQHALALAQQHVLGEALAIRKDAEHGGVAFAPRPGRHRGRGHFSAWWSPARAAAISGRIAGSSMVAGSRYSSPSAIFFMVPRRILPERVFGSRLTTTATLNDATGPMRS